MQRGQGGRGQGDKGATGQENGGQENRGQGGRGHGDKDVDALFQLPLIEFTAARNSLAARLKKAGQADEAEQIKALAKPSVSAWVVNQLYWKHRKAFDRLIETGERFRRAQASQIAGKPADIRGLIEARRTALAELARLAADTLRDAGHNPTPETMRRITLTLEALSTYGSLPDAPPSGRLTDDVDPPGFETLAALVPRVGHSTRESGGQTRIIPFQEQRHGQKPPRKKVTPDEAARQRDEEHRAQIAAAKAAVHEAEAALRDARKAAQEAEAVLKKAAAHAKETEKEKAAAEKVFEKATAEAESARQEARRIAAEAEEAAQAVEDAERALEKAKRELENKVEK